MNQENQNVTRRKFLTAGSAIAVSSLLATEAKAAPESAALPLSDDPVTTEAVQTLSNKTIRASNNTLIIGTTTLNVLDIPTDYSTTPNPTSYAPEPDPITGLTDITKALNRAISLLSGVGGRILIPAGVWQCEGNIVLNEAITIEGIWHNMDLSAGSELKLKAGGTCMFKITSDKRNCSIKNLRVNLSNAATTATGLLITNLLPSNYTPGTYLEGVAFVSGKYGVKVDGIQLDGETESHFECMLTSFNRVAFLGCKTGFYCNSINGNYSFDNCYFRIASVNGIALELKSMGNLSAEHCYFVGTSTAVANVAPTDNSTILKTVGVFNNINFYDCQDENVQYLYQNSTNYYPYSPITFRNCLIQSRLKFTAAGTVVFDSCFIHVTNLNKVIINEKEEQETVPDTLVIDNNGAYPLGIVNVFLQGLNHIYGAPGFINGKLFIPLNPYSRLIDIAGNINPEKTTPDVFPTYQSINSSVGIISVAMGASSARIYNNLVRTDSIIFCQLRTNDINGVGIKYIDTQDLYFDVCLNGTASTKLYISFELKILKFNP